MKFLGISSKNISKLFAGRILKRLEEHSIEITLRRSVRMIDEQTIGEIRSYLKSQLTNTGGFADRGGKSDLYYSLFGYYIAEALKMDEVKPLLKDYLTNVISTQKLSGVHLKCAVILYIKLFGKKTLPSPILKNGKIQTHYSDFINLLASYYTEDYLKLFFIRLKLRKFKNSVQMPCSVTSAQLILNNNSDGDQDPWKKLSNFYRKGSFSAFCQAPQSDLLSTGVALYALMFSNSDLSFIKPDCLEFIDSLYSGGGFCATVFDPVPDVEYTFYGLLGLGSLAN